MTESSDEASEEGDWPLQSGSESEDQWDELSDISESMDITENDMKEDDLDSDMDDGEEEGYGNGEEEQEGNEDDDEDESDANGDIVENGLSD